MVSVCIFKLKFGQKIGHYRFSQISRLKSKEKNKDFGGISSDFSKFFKLSELLSDIEFKVLLSK